MEQIRLWWIMDDEKRKAALEDAKERKEDQAGVV